MRLNDRSKFTPEEIIQYGFADCYQPVPDFMAPSMLQIDRVISFIQRSIAQHKPVDVSCYEGRGRTGTVLACYLVSKGATPEDAIRETRAKRRGSIETKEQEDAIVQYSQKVKKERMGPPRV